MISKRKSFSVALALVVSGCNSEPSTDPKDYVGEYIYQPSDADPGELASFILLKRDSTAFEVRFIKNTGRVSTSQERWGLSYITSEQVTIGNEGFPITKSGSSLKLVINEDLGEYYEKVR